LPHALARVSTSDLWERLSDPATQLVDVRPVDAWNGWRLRDEARGGHIPGARSLPRAWSDWLEWIEVARGKGLRPEAPLVLYGYEVGEVEAVAERFRREGFREVAAYHDLVEEWCRDDALPLARLPRHEQLVPPSWLAARLSGEGDDLVVCHAHYRNRPDYEKGHIPGALSLDTLTLESPETWNRRSPDEVRDALLSLGISSRTTVVLYGRHSFPDNRDPFPGSAAGQLAAFRCAFVMLWAGVEDVRVLNGGLRAWADAGYEITRGESEARPAFDFGAQVPGRPELAVDTPEAKAILAAPDANLVSVRSWPEYIGEVSGYNYIEKKGRIPGSVFGNCGSDAYHMEEYRNLDHTTRQCDEIEANWRTAGITSDRRNAFYCGTGWRGAEAFFNAWLMGWPRVAVYDGGWFEWSADPANPIETGVPGDGSP
jgi:thiosulfate/3-mercaptopyruvate sulfurtransferase